MESGAQTKRGKVWALAKGRAVSYNAALKVFFKCIYLTVKVYSDGHIDISHLSPEN